MGEGKITLISGFKCGLMLIFKKHLGTKVSWNLDKFLFLFKISHLSLLRNTFSSFLCTCLEHFMEAWIKCHILRNVKRWCGRKDGYSHASVFRPWLKGQVVLRNSVAACALMNAGVCYAASNMQGLAVPSIIFTHNSLDLVRLGWLTPGNCWLQ